LDQNQTNEALQELQKAAELRPNDPDIYYELAISYEKMGKKAEAIETWQRVIQNSKDADMTQNAQTHVAALQTAS
jgi:Flp pilus assembly protein TadD